MRIKNIYTSVMLICMTFGFAMTANSQILDFLARTANEIDDGITYGRSGIRSSITQWNSCKSGALTFERGAVALYGSNGYVCTGSVNSAIKSKLKTINKEGGTINDINIIENGNYIILYNDGRSWYGVIPESVNSALSRLSSSTFYSISFNEKGIYAITTSNSFYSNDKLYQAYYDDHKYEFGTLWSVNICNEGAVFCYSDGCRYVGKIPKAVETAINQFQETPRFVKFNAHGDYLICASNGYYMYNIPDVGSSRTSTMVTYDYTKDHQKKLEKEALSKWESKAEYKYIDSTGVHSVSCEGAHVDDGLYAVLRTYVSSESNSAPNLEILLMDIGKKYEDLMKTIPDGGLENMYMTITMSNGEILSSNGVYIEAPLHGFGGNLFLTTSLYYMRSNKRTLSGTEASGKYVIDCLSHNQILSITFKGRYTVDMSKMDTKGQLLYDFTRLANESGHINLLP